MEVDEIHFLLTCQKSNKVRKEILDQIEDKFTNLKSLDNKSKFLWLLSADDYYVYNQLHKLLTKLYTFRTETVTQKSIKSNNVGS